MSDRTRTARRNRPSLVVSGLLGCLVLLATARPGTAAPAATVLSCGQTATGSLEPGEIAYFEFDALPGEAVAIEAVDVSGNKELLQLRLEGPDLRMNTCTGRLQPTLERPGLAHLTGGRYRLEVADCRSDARVEFAVTLNLLSESRRSCGTLAPCDKTVVGNLSEPGEVDAFRFAARRDEAVTLSFPGLLDTRGGIEMRVFDPDGLPVGAASGCGVQRSFTTTKLGTYTVLANACLGYGTGNYRFTWDTEEDCPPLLLRGLHSAGGSIEIAVGANGTRVERIAGAGLTCGFASLSEFRSPVAAATDDDAFAVESIQISDPAGGHTTGVTMDGILIDSDGDEQPDQAIGGVGLAADGGRCVFQWAATNLADSDGDAWGDIAERRFGSDPDDAASVPETSLLPTTALLGPGACLDAADNDGDGATDLADETCIAEPSRPAGEPKTYAGRHTGGQAFWLERDIDEEIVHLVDAVELGCQDALLPSLHLPMEFAVANNGRFGQQRLPVPSAEATPANLTIDGIFFDIDGDGVDEQAIGALELRLGSQRCVRQWAATAHLDSDNDGWSDAVERRLGSDPRPLPEGLGGASVPEHRLLPTSLVVTLDVCDDGVDNDGDGKRDGEDAPACPIAVPTSTPVPTFTQTALPTATPTATPTPDVPLPSTTPTATAAQTTTAPPASTPTSTTTLPPATATPTAPIVATATVQQPTPCVGDCDGDSAITVDEILTLVATSLGAAPLNCSAGDLDASGSITVDEIVSAVNRALLGCN